MTRITVQLGLGPIGAQDICAYAPYERAAGELGLPVGVDEDPIAPSTKLRRRCLDWDCSLSLVTGHPPDLEGRGLACCCYSGKYLGATVRLSREKVRLAQSVEAPPEVRRRFAPSEEASEGFLSPISHVVGLIDDAIGAAALAEDGRSGLVVISGATNSAKSTISRGLVHAEVERERAKYLASGRLRRPHLLTIEDPIEEYYFARSKGADVPLEVVEPWDAQQYGLDYTPRQLRVDTTSLRLALKSALRQTPAAVYVGEIRNPKDWQYVVAFAGTGHLIFTTAHAGSLVETMDRIFQATEANTPSKRGQIAERILGIVHVRRLEDSGWSLAVPALWRRTRKSVASLVGVGLSSILPENPGASNIAGTLGRHWFVESLRKKAPHSSAGTMHSEAWAERADKLERLSLQLDLGGV